MRRPSEPGDREESRLRSSRWLHDPHEPEQAGVYLGRYGNYGLTPEELTTGRPIVGIAQSGSELSPCNFIHVQLAQRVKDGIRDAGGIPLEFPTHPIQETARRPTAALDRNLAYLGLVEILAGYPFDAVVLTTGCDKTTPAALMAAATTDIPAIVLSGGPMVDSYVGSQRVGSGMVLWEGRRRIARGEITGDELAAELVGIAPSAGHCNIMGTALSMNSVAEMLGMSLAGNAAIPAPYSARAKMAYRTGYRSVELARAGIRPSGILTRRAFLNAIVGVTAIGGSSNCVPHLLAIAAHAGVDLTIDDWDEFGHDVNLIADVQPAGHAFAEEFYRAGGVPAVMGELLRAGAIDGRATTVSGGTIGDLYTGVRTSDSEVIRPYAEPVRERAGFVVLHGNFIDSAIMKLSVAGAEFSQRWNLGPDGSGVFEMRAVVFEGPEDYHRRIDDPALSIDETCALLIRGVGPRGYPGAAEVVNMTPPASLARTGVAMLPCIGDGRQSGTSDSPSILHVTPEAATGGGLALVRDGDVIRVDIPRRRMDLLVDEAELAQRRVAPAPATARTPWEAIYISSVSELDTGAVFPFATEFRAVGGAVPRHSH